jgi:CO dehydrogenase/acetyl-CoA synthase alpha subunit
LAAVVVGVAADLADEVADVFVDVAASDVEVADEDVPVVGEFVEGAASGDVDGAGVWSVGAAWGGPW